VLNSDVVVIGAGRAGLFLASRLARLRVRVLVLESGGADHPQTSHALNEVVNLGDAYRGASDGRSRGLGGTSVKWGAAMLPFAKEDIGPNTAGWPIEWPIAFEDLSPYWRDAEKLFGLPDGPFDRSGDIGEGFRLRSAKWSAFRFRNVAHLLANDIHGPHIEVWTNATVDGFKLRPDGRLGSISARSPNGQKLEARGTEFVLAAGAIESTRLLLQLDRLNGQKIFEPHHQLGRYFHDHLSAPIAHIQPLKRRLINQTFGLRFERGGMRDLRIEPSAELRQSCNLPGGFAHVVALTDEKVGYTILRNLYLELQRGRMPRTKQFTDLARDLPWLVHAGWWRVLRRQLLAPHNAKFELVQVIEQKPVATNRISLSSDAVDDYGSPLAQIDWRVNEVDMDNFAAFQTKTLTAWEGCSYRTLGTLSATSSQLWGAMLREGGGIFHPGGTTRMAKHCSDGVVDESLSTFAVPNLKVVSTSTFPTGGSANPSFTLIALALRSADLIAKGIQPTSTILRRTDPLISRIATGPY
jgi:choline dehydrogenase-like flavoprotein